MMATRATQLSHHQPIRRLHCADGVAHFLKGVIEQIHGVVARGRQGLEQRVYDDVPLRTPTLEQFRERTFANGL